MVQKAGAPVARTGFKGEKKRAREVRHRLGVRTIDEKGKDEE